MTTHAWHRPLLVTAALMGLLTVLLVPFALLDDRLVTGAPALVKPLKFSISLAVYCLTMSCLYSRLGGFRRAANRLGWVISAGALIEIGIIGSAAALGTTSHFNVSTPLHAAAFFSMGVAIVVVWVAMLIFGVLFALSGPRGSALHLAICLSIAITLLGMAQAFLMTVPTAGQLANFAGVTGAHTVGAADGGPGLPFVGWSTVAGDLRVAHFIGIHALQAVPALVLLLAWGGRRWVPLADLRVQRRLIWLAAVGYVGVVLLTTAQALLGQPVTRPDGGILWIGLSLAVVVLSLAGWTTLRAARLGGQPQAAPATPALQRS